MDEARAAGAATRPTKTFDVFVAYTEQDRAWVEGSLLVALREIARVATRADIQLGEPELVGLSRLVEQSAWQVIVASPAWRADNLAQLITLLAQTHGHQTDTWPVIPVMLEPVELPLNLRILRGLDATTPDDRSSAVDHLYRLVSDSKEGPARPPVPPCPYPGMQPFDYEDGTGDPKPFFGRTAEIEEVVQRLRLNQCVAIIGPSGCGKSSLVHAGVQPRLHRDGWQVCRLRPGLWPVDSLQAATANLGDRKAVIIVDQLEELFTVSAEQADEFCEELTILLSRSDRKLLVTMRADFYPQLMTSPLWPILRDHRLELLPLSGDALREAIVGPARKIDVYVESALVERLVADAAGEPGRLPLVQETLVLLWSRLELRYLPLSAYDQLVAEALVMSATAYGVAPRTGLHVALARHADAVLAQIPEAGRAIARRILLRLVQFFDGRADTRRPQPVDSLRAEGDDPDLFDGVLETLTKERLVTKTGTIGDETQVADLSHESLITAWPTFGKWVRERRASEAARRRLQSKVEEYLRLGQGDGGLLDKVELADAEQFVTSPDAADLGTDPDLHRLISKSRAAIEADDARRARWNRILRRLTVALALLLVAAVVLGGVAFRQRDEAREQQAFARSGELALLATERAGEALGGALLLGREAVSLRATPRTRSALLAVLESQPHIVRELWGGSSVQALATSPDRSRVAAGLRNGSVVVWDAASGQPLFEPLRASDEPRSIAFSHDGELLAVGDRDGVLAVWDADTGNPRVILRPHSGSVRALAFSPDGDWLASGGQDGAVVLHPRPFGDGKIPLVGHTDWVNTLAFTPDSRALISGAGRAEGEVTDTRILSWRLDTRAPAEIGKHEGAVRALAVSPDGRSLVSAGAEGAVSLWDLATGERRDLLDHTERVFAVAFSPDGKLVASGGRDYDIRIWDAEVGTLLSTLRGRRTAVRGLAFIDEKTLISGANESALRVWDLGGDIHPRLAEPLDGQGGAIAAIAVNGNGTIVATAAADNTVVIRNRDGDVVGDEPIQLSARARRLALSADGSTLATISADGELQLWDTKSGTSLAGPVETNDRFAAVAVSGDGSRVATGGEGRVVRLWDGSLRPNGVLASGEDGGHRSRVTGLAFYPDDQTLASSGADGEVWLWDLPGLRGNRLNLPSGQLTGIAVDASGQILAAGDRDGRVLLWWQPRINPDAVADAVLVGLNQVGEAPTPVTGVAFSPDGRLAAIGEDGAMATWEIHERRAFGLGQPLSLGERAHAVAFAGGGMSLLIGLDSGGLRWDMSLESWLAKACEVANRNLTPVELETELGQTAYRKTCPDLPDTRPAPSSVFDESEETS